MAITLLRHTRPAIAEGVCYGRTDLDLASSFLGEAAALCPDLPRFERIVSSPLSRCHRLADYLAKQLERPLSIDERLIEMDFGRWEGIAWRDIPRAELDAWAEDFLHARPHGGETVAMLRDRTLDALGEIKAVATPTLIVTHAGVIKAALATGDTSEDFNSQIGFGAFITLPLGEELSS